MGIKASLKDKKTAIIIITAGILGILFIYFSSFFEHLETGSQVKENRIDSYVSKIEEDLKRTVSAIKGAGECEVFITVESSFETVYASNSSLDESGDETKSTKNTKKELAVTVNKSTGEEPVIVKELCPKIGGILIVCTGGDSKEVSANIKNAVSTATGVSISKIYVTGGYN